MAKTTDLADKVRQKQADDLHEIESIRSEHEQRLKQLLKDELHTIENDTKALRRLARKQLRRSVKPLALIYAAALIGVLICLAAGWYANHQKNVIEHRLTKMHNVPNLHITKCGKKNPRTCVEIKPNVRGYGKNQQWKVIQQ